MTKSVVYTRLKSIDLHAMSAFEIASKTLGCDWLAQLRRYDRWDLEWADQKDHAKDIQTIIQSTYYIGNSNKHSFFTESLPTRDYSDGHDGYFVQVKNDLSDQNQPIIDGLRRKASIQLNQLSHSTLWEIVVDKRRLDKSPKEVIESQLIKTTSAKQGLLMNPLIEEFEWKSADSL